MSTHVGEQAQEAFCIVERGGVRLAVPVADVCRVLGRRRLTPIPRTPSHIAGLVSDGEQAVLALRLDSWLTAGIVDRPPAALVVLRGTTPALGIAVDRLCGVALLPQVVDVSPADAAAGGVATVLVAAHRRGAEGIVPVLAVSTLVALLTDSLPPPGRSGAGGHGR